MCDNHEHSKLRSNNRDLQEIEKQVDRRHFLKKTSLGLGALAFSSLMGADKVWSSVNKAKSDEELLKAFNQNNLGLPHHLPKAKRIIYLFQSGGPSQLDLFDYKPKLLILEMFSLKNVFYLLVSLFLVNLYC